MEKSTKKVILRVFWPLYHLLFIYDLANFQNINLCTIFYNIFKALIYTALLFSMTIAWISELIHCIQHQFQLNEMALQLAMMINLTSITINYVAIGMKKTEIHRLIGRFQVIVEQST